MFIDKARIRVTAGRGGDGSVSFHREKYVTAGGPDGGDGGRGGHIYIQGNDHMSTLMDFRYRHVYQAQNGENGQRRQRFGKKGEDLTLRVPKGTLIRDASNGALLHDVSDDTPFLLCKGGRGGWGNKHFATPTRQSPRFAKAGLDGDSLDIELELKLLADVGFIGFPNAGKSSLLTVISAARPKVADYPFTTLSPHLGVVSVSDDVHFVCADIPGLIEGAADGAGLGHDFLRHIERCRLLVHVVDAAGLEGRDPKDDFDAINRELFQYNEALSGRPQIVAANKIDILSDDDVLESLRNHVAPFPFYAISAATTAGVSDLVGGMAALLETLPPIAVYEADAPVITLETNDDKAGALDIVRAPDGSYDISGEWLDVLARDINFGDYESRAYFDRRLRNAGVYDRLEAMDVEEGDTIRLLGMEFDYVR